jgi:SOS-response transcriptional repressor LexA
MSFEDNNYVIVSTNIADLRNNDVVLAIIDNSATIKTFKKGISTLILSPESDNNAHKPIFLDSY